MGEVNASDVADTVGVIVAESGNEKIYEIHREQTLAVSSCT